MILVMFWQEEGLGRVKSCLEVVAMLNLIIGYMECWEVHPDDISGGPDVAPAVVPISIALIFCKPFLSRRYRGQNSCR